MTNRCAACDDSLIGDPTYSLILEIEDRTRSAIQFTAGETNVKRLCLNRELCEDCWEEYHDKLSR